MTEHVRRLPPPELGPMLKMARVRVGLGVREAARRAGLSHSYLLRLESGQRCPSVAVVEGLTGALRLSDDEQFRLAESAVADAGRAHPLRRFPVP
ncbi:hypothetical protein GCM10009839_38880 [Catenulispora yoronensis]|uniref:HTH cro/C1-type domain-containing protein n=1 Tax=Catenulispora yoronensis TaxID=450799 RepID=A0ABP5FWX9_9ACTN